MKKVLIIEDKVLQAKNLQDDIIRLGHDVYIALDGRDGLDKAIKIKPDLVILDFGLPEMDGFEVCERIRSNESIQDTPIIMVTGAKKEIEDKVEGFKIGADDYITKPYNIEELIGRIENMLRRTSTSPFSQDEAFCKINLLCQPGQPIHFRIEGNSTISDQNLDINTEEFAQFGNDVCCNEWQFRTKNTGKRIYKIIFQDHPQILNAYGNSKGRKRDFNLKLCFESDLDFFRVPVEFMVDETGLGGRRLIELHPISRRIINVQRQNDSLSPKFFNNLWKNKEELKILLVASNADETGSSLQYVDTEILELKNDIQESLTLQDIPHRVECISSHDASLQFVRKKLKNCEYHILHYAGHGFYKESLPDRSYLPFWSRKNCRGGVERLSISSLSRMLRNSNLSFVYLSCCSGSRAAGSHRLIDNDFPGLAVSIIKAGIPSVLSFRSDVSDEKATCFAKSFYKSLFEQGYPDKALYDAQCEIATTNLDDPIWISPVLIDQG